MYRSDLIQLYSVQISVQWKPQVSVVQIDDILKIFKRGRVYIPTLEVGNIDKISAFNWPYTL